MPQLKVLFRKWLLKENFQSGLIDWLHRCHFSITASHLNVHGDVQIK